MAFHRVHSVALPFPAAGLCTYKVEVLSLGTFSSLEPLNGSDVKYSIAGCQRFACRGGILVLHRASSYLIN